MSESEFLMRNSFLRLSDAVRHHHQTKPVMDRADRLPFKEAEQQEASLLKKMERARESGQKEKLRRLTKLYLRSHSARLMAVVRANEKMGHERVSNEEVHRIASSLDPRRGTTEPVAIRAKTKKLGYRIITEPGIENRALQILINNALKAQASLHPDQYLMNGGRPEACEKIRDLLQEGYKFAVKLDIKNAYGSLGAEGLKKVLPLPHEVVENVVRSRHLNLVPIRQDSHCLYSKGVGPVSLLAGGLRGIPQGSVCSALVCEIMLAYILAALPDGTQVVMYADNILVLTRTRKEARSVLKTLLVAIRRNPAGPLTPSESEIRQASRGFSFLGYEFRTRHGVPRVCPTERNLVKIHREVAAKLKKGRRLDKLRTSVRSWAASFSLWEDADSFRDTVLRTIDRVANARRHVAACARAS